MTHPSVRINPVPTARHRDKPGCFDIVVAPALLVALAVLALTRKRTR